MQASAPAPEVPAASNRALTRSRRPGRPARRLALALGAVAIATLTGCATSYNLDNLVNTYSGLAEVPAAGYRFERTPLQASVPTQPRIEALAEAALARAGLRRDDTAPRYAVQAWAGNARVPYPWGRSYHPGWGPGPYGSFGVGAATGGRVGVGVGIGMPFGGVPVAQQPWYRREVGLLVRDLGTGQIVYESNAVNDGPWLDADRVTGAMFDAALQGFPRPPAGPRTVNVLMPR